MSLIRQASKALSDAGFQVNHPEPGVVTLKSTNPNGKTRSVGRIWEERGQIHARLSSQTTHVARALGEAGIPMSDWLYQRWHKRRLPHLGWIREEADGTYWAATHLGQSTQELGFHPTFGAAAEACREAGAVAIVPLSGDQTGYDGLDALIEFLVELRLVKDVRP